MGVDEALTVAEQLILERTGQALDDLEREIFRRAWVRDRYRDIAEALDYEESYVRDRGAQLFKILSQAFGTEMSKSNFKGYIERYQFPVRPSVNNVNNSDLNFVGRERNLSDLDDLIAQGAKIILIQGEGGLGKTTLARKYLEMQAFPIQLELWMATETENITRVESIVEEWLRRDLNEEAGQDFGINLERLRKRLRESDQKIGILIDNLESALDGLGKFIPSRRPYVDLLRVLSDPKVNSVTLITSRERLNEAGVGRQLYCPDGIDQDSWNRYFRSRGIQGDPGILREIREAFGGNAKAMKIISGTILTDFYGELDSYWQQNNSDLLIENELNDLVESQFNRLQRMDAEAYKLLCRLGCYRYQDVTHVSLNGVCCLLWDIPVENRNRIVRSLQERSLIESRRGQKYWLHPVIRAKAINKLKFSEDWNITHEKAAEFWIKSVDVVETVDDALRSLEAYHHYLEIGDFERACDVIVQLKNNQWGEELPLGWLFYRLGLLQQMESVVTRIIDNVRLDERLGTLYNLLGYIYRSPGNLQKALDCHQRASRIAETFNQPQLQISSLLNLGLCKKDLWQIEEAIAYFNSVYSLTKPDAETRPEYFIYAQCCLAYLHSCLDQKSIAINYANQIDADHLPSRLTAWGRGYSLLYLSATYRNLDEIERSFSLYRTTISYSEENHFTQIKANALHGMAQLHRMQGEFETALSYHDAAIDLLNKIGAKCDLAEAQFQLGITFQTMNQPEKSRIMFYQAMQLFEEIQAPRHLERIRAAIAGR